MEGRGDTFDMLDGLRIDELPGIRSVETANPDRRDKLRIEIGEVDAVPSVGSRLQRLPVRDTTEGPAELAP